MPRYAIGGAVLDSAVALPEVTALSTGPAGMYFDVLAPVDAIDPPRTVQRRWTRGDDDGATFAAFAREGDAWRIHFEGLADFVVSADGRRIAATPLRATPDATLRHLLLDQVLPLAMSRHGRFALHACGVVIDGRACAFAGRSGSGKSTLGAFLARDGAALLCDDCLVVEPRGERWTALPWYPGLRLWPEDGLLPAAQEPVASYTSKVRVGGAGALPFRATPAPLAAVFILAEDGDEVSLSPPGPRDAVVALVESTYLLAQDEPAALEAQLDFATRLAAAVPCPILRYPYRHDVLPRVRELVLEALAGAEP